MGIVNVHRSYLWKVSLLISLLIHLAAGILIISLPTEKKEKETPFLARLITPDELEKRPAKMAAGSPPEAFLPRAKAFGPPGQVKPLLPESERYRVLREKPSQITPSLPLPAPEGPPSERGARVPALPGQSDPGPAIQKGNGEFSRQHGEGERTPAGPSLKEKLFDREVVDKFAKKEETKREGSITFETEEFKYHTYMLRLKEKIEGIWIYPRDAAMKGIYGDLYIRFTIRKTGMLGDMELTRTSGHRSLDEAAMQALKDAQPFWPLPEEWGKENLTITGHFVYSIYGAYVR